MLPFLTKHKLGIIISFICSLITGIAVAVHPLIVKYIVDSGLMPAINGEIVQEGTYDELAQREGLFRELLEGPSVTASEYDEQ